MNLIQTTCRKPMLKCTRCHSIVSKNERHCCCPPCVGHNFERGPSATTCLECGWSGRGYHWASFCACDQSGCTCILKHCCCQTTCAGHDFEVVPRTYLEVVACSDYQQQEKAPQKESQQTASQQTARPEKTNRSNRSNQRARQRRNERHKREAQKEEVNWNAFSMFNQYRMTFNQGVLSYAKK